MGKRAIAGLVAAALVWPMAAAAQEDGDKPFDPSKVDLPAMIECRNFDHGAYTEFGEWVYDHKDEAAKAGYIAEAADNLFMAGYRLAKPITVFGRQADRIAFVSGGVLAVLDEADPHSLAKQLGVTAVIDTHEKFMGVKTISSSKEEVLAGVSSTITVELNVSTVSTAPGKTLVGCSYRTED